MKVINKLKLGLLTIAVILVVGASYAVYNEDNVINKSAADIISNTNDLNTNVAPSIMDTTNKFTANKDILSSQDDINFGKTCKNIPGTNLQVNATNNYTDLYTQCCVCGGYLALGEVTKMLPQGAICPDGCDGDLTFINEVRAGKVSLQDHCCIFSYEEVYAEWEKYGDRCPEPVVTDEYYEMDDEIVSTDYDNDSSEVGEVDSYLICVNNFTCY